MLKTLTKSFLTATYVRPKKLTEEISYEELYFYNFY